MKIKYFGTAAAEGYPAAFCECENCLKARRLGGKNLRMRAMACVDGKILIDYNNDAFWFSVNGGLDLTYLHTLIITHKHEDHLYPEDLGNRREGFSHFAKDYEGELTVYGSEKSMEPVRKFIERTHPLKTSVKTVEEFAAFETEGYKITPLPANHDYNNCKSVIYIIEKDGKSLLYANDTGYFYDSVWEYFKKKNVRFDLVSLDCTSMLDDNAINWHMGLKACTAVKDRLLCEGFADQNTKMILTHFSHNDTPVYDDAKIIAAQSGFEITYDGIEFEI